MSSLQHTTLLAGELSEIEALASYQLGVVCPTTDYLTSVRVIEASKSQIPLR